MAPQKYLTLATLLGTLLGSGCVTGPESEGTPSDEPGMDGEVTSPMSDGTAAPTPNPGVVEANAAPVYPTQHPRIYLTPNRARLNAALTAKTPAATRFKALVDQWVAGSSIWGFSAWNAVL